MSLESTVSSLQPGASGTMHWSRPEGLAFLAWLMRWGGEASGESYQRITNRMHANNGASSARRLLEDLGFPRAADEIDWKQTGVSEEGLLVGVYRLSKPLLAVCYRCLSDVDPKRTKARKAELMARLQAHLQEAYARPVQAPLFGAGSGQPTGVSRQREEANE